MARDQFSKIAYKTLQQGKSIAGLAHKQLSSRIMNFILPDNKLDDLNLNKKLLADIQESITDRPLQRSHDQQCRRLLPQRF